MSHLTFANRSNVDLVDANYAKWRTDAGSVDAEWRAFFEGFELASTQPPKAGKSGAVSSAPAGADAMAQARVLLAIEAFRRLGHTEAKLSPVHPAPGANPELSPKALGLDGVSPEQQFHTGDFLGGKTLPLKTIVAELRRIYAGETGVEFAHINDSAKRNWLTAKFEAGAPAYDKAKRIRILDKIVEAEAWERFLHTRFVGVKRFSVEGAEAQMPALWETIENAPGLGVSEIQLGMAHRGRLNVLLHIAGKPHVELLSQFGDGYIPDTSKGSGDVKYHLGHSAVQKTAEGKPVKVTLAYNPSHLEFVGPVVQGKARARQDALGDRKAVLPVVLHGDAAFIGQGVVAETFNLMRLKGYTVGGTLHIVANNQIGFTTDPDESRSTRYCSDLAKFVEAPVFHVNGDNPEAVVRAVEIALEYRKTFGDDAVIDIVCFRRYGHNETDEPLFTQPLLYKAIAAHPGPGEVYGKRLQDEGVIAAGELDAKRKAFESKLDEALAKAKEKQAGYAKKNPNPAPAVFDAPYAFEAKTAISAATLKRVGEALATVPAGFGINSKIKRQLDAKAEILKAGAGFDWSLGEGLAFGSLLLEGHAVRLSGQDCERGTFSHRHAVQHDGATNAESCQLASLDPKQGPFTVINSALSECAVLGVEYGYTLENRDALVIWEGQFGDFANGAQVIIDQFIASAESKWGETSGITLLLPHGYEGQGPEHSSARMERFLQLCAEKNIQVANLTTPAQLFHALRRQVKAVAKKPLVIMSPKSLLRAKSCVSDAADFTAGSFKEVIADAAVKKAKRAVICSGKVYYELEAERAAKGKQDEVALIRIEQLYPLNDKALAEAVKAAGSPKSVVWCQEEPANAGSWQYVAPELERVLGIKPGYAGRPAHASPAVGATTMHKLEQAKLLAEAFA